MTKTEFEHACKDEDAWKQSFCINIIRKYVITQCYRHYGNEYFSSWGYESFLWELNEKHENGKQLITDLTGKGIFKVAQQIFKDGEYKDDKD